TLRLSMEQALQAFAQDPPIAQLCQAMVDLGLGYLRLGQSSTTLSRGEAQRVKLATWLAKSGPALLLMDEPDRGLHPQDVVRLLQAIDALVERGSTVLAISHHRALWAAADHRVTLRSGHVVPTQPLSTAPLHASQGPRALSQALDSIRLRGVRTHNLKSLDLDIPHRQLTVVVGPSGSGKSSLAFDTVAALAWGRFSETLPFQIRRFMRRLPQPDLDSAQGLTPVVALRQGLPKLGARSTVATQSGLGPLLRLLWSRAGQVDGQPSGLSAGHFSPDRALGACPMCEGLGVVQRCTPQGLFTHPELPIAHGAMQGTKPGQFFGEHDGQYMATLQAVLPDVDLSVPWKDLPTSAQDIAFNGAGEQQVSVSWKFQRGDRAGEHHFEGTWPGLCQLVENEASVRGQRKSGAAWSAPLQDQPCPDCGGQRLGPQARAVALSGISLPRCMARPLKQLPGLLSELKDPVVQALLPELRHALDDLVALGLGHLQLDRRSDTLSGGELQRLRLTGVLQSGLTQLTLVLDEPCAGLDEQGVLALIQRLRGLVAQGNTVLVVEHRPALITAADHIIELGPGAGPLGGELLLQGPASQVLAGQGPTAQALRAPQAVGGGVGAPGLWIRGCTAPGLNGLDVRLPAWGLVALTGPSGSGKSSLMERVLQASFLAGEAVGCAEIKGLERFAALRSPGVFTGSLTSPLDTLRLMAPLQKAFAKAGAEGGVAKRAFSFRSPAGRCPACHGRGVERVAMDALADLELGCVVCDGRRYRPEVLAVEWKGLSVDRLLALPARELVEVLPVGTLRDGAHAMQRVGLGHLSLGRRGSTLSGGEAQRLRLAESLLFGAHPTLHLLEEPGRGLHESDLQGLLGILAELGNKGDLVVVSTHRQRLISAAGQVLVLG
ncbi:MAG: excinuclease ABC subunit A, partial [Cognaticolwellia sp.]